jgi:hypothetical protein
MADKDAELDSGVSGEENQDDKKKDKKESVPLSQFLAAIESANQKNARLEAQIEELKKEKPIETTKRYTRTDLNAAVAAGQITEVQADELYANQVREDTKKEVTQEVLSVVQAQATQERIVTDLAEYKRLAPEILDDSSDVRKKIVEEFNDLVLAGLPKNLATERAAIRAVLGPLEKLKVARSARRDDESYEETGSGGGGGGNRTPKSLKDTLTPREKDYYEGMIKKGMYPDWKAVESELSFARPEVRRKAGARV